MTAALRAEVRKLLTTQVWFWLTVLAAGLTVLIASLISGFSKLSDGGRPLESALGAAIGFSSVLAGVLGIIGLTGEYRHLTATPTFLAVPRRGVVVTAKLVTYLVTGLLLGVLCVGLALAVATPWLDSKGFPVDIGSDITRRVIIGGTLSVAIYGIIGVGLGALVRNQIAAIVGLLVYLFVVEPIIRSIPKVQSAYPYLPGGAGEALTQSGDTTNLPMGLHLLHPWQGGLLLLGYGLVFALLGSWLTVRRDIT